MNELFASGFLFGLAAGLVYNLIARRRWLRWVREVVQL